MQSLRTSGAWVPRDRALSRGSLLLRLSDPGRTQGGLERGFDLFGETGSFR